MEEVQEWGVKEMNLSNHFTLQEATESSTAQRLDIVNEPDPRQLSNMYVAASGMEQVRTLLGNLAIHVDSWLRVPELNKAVRGAANSAHMSGHAVDFKCPEFGTPLEIVRRVQTSGIKFDQLIQEGTWVHISFDPAMRQQVLTAHFGPGGTTYSEGA